MTQSEVEKRRLQLVFHIFTKEMKEIGFTVLAAKAYIRLISYFYSSKDDIETYV